MRRKIKNHLSKIFFGSSTVLWLLSLPIAAKAADSVSDGLRSGGLKSAFGSGPLQSQDTVAGLIVQIIKILLFFSGIIAVVFVIMGGYMYVTSAGSEEQAEKGKNTLTNALIGVVITILSYVIVSVISNLVLYGAGRV